jgi:hypothetical protein
MFPSFHQMPSSTAWQPVTLGIGGPGPLTVWNWFKPSTFPHGLVFLIPPEAFTHPAVSTLTLRNLLHVSGLNPATCWQWFYAGQMIEAMGGVNPMMDYPLPSAGEGADPHLYVTFIPDAAPVMMPSQGMPVAEDYASLLQSAPMASEAEGTYVPAGDAETMYRNIESDWKSIYHLEKNLGIARKQMDGMMGRLNGLNRDLGPDERNAASQLEQKEWQDSRRRLRDLQTGLSRLMKEHDMGVTSAAGKKTYFEQIYQEYVVPRKPFDGLQQVYRDIEMHRKMLTNIQNQITSIMQKAQQDGEARGQQVLRKIQDAVRANRLKK